MYYRIGEILEECERDEIGRYGQQYVALLTSAEWAEEKDSFDMGIDIEPDLVEILSTQVEVNYDSLTGTFCIPDRNNLSGNDRKFAFALDEKGVVFIDDSGAAKELIRAVQRSRKWRLPSLERFLYDFLEQIIKDDLALMENYERELDEMEENIMNEKGDVTAERVDDIRKDIRELRIHYEQLMDLGQELEENENHFFQPENLRYFRLFCNRIARLRDISTGLRDYTIQIREIYKSHLDLKQNHIMTVLTVVTTIFMPLTLIVGWYGMNFRYMPEVETRWGYPVVIVVSVVIVLGSLLFFKKKKWL